MGGIEEQAPEVVKTIAKQALGRALMLLEADWLALVFPDPNLEAPTKGQNQEGEEPLDALRAAQMGVLERENDLLRQELAAAKEREKWLQNQIDQIQQRLLPAPRQGIIERIAEAVARLRRPKGSA